LTGTLLIFASTAGPLDYGRRFARLRWQKAIAPERVATADHESRASSVLGDAKYCVVVLDDLAIPSAPVQLPAGSQNTVAAARSYRVDEVPPIHTLRELEVEGFPPAASPGPMPPPAIAFSLPHFPPLNAESLSQFIQRLLGQKLIWPAGFRALLVENPSVSERPEVTRHFRPGIRRLLDVGCGSGAASAALKRSHRGLRVTGIERDAQAASTARPKLDAVWEGDAAEGLRRLSDSGERFDAFLFADILEHMENPIAVLRQAREIAEADAALVASVPNVGHLSVIRDLLLGRFDPAPAGLLDAGHLRWFSKRFLEEALAEGGWSVVAIHAEPGAPAPAAESFLERFSDWPGVERESLTAYQWVAVAHADRGAC
jgi:SAM-dependent methyltransferase